MVQKLLRFDYDVSTIMEITDDIINDLTVEAQSWADTYNKFTFKYTDPERDKIASVEYTNEASRISLGYDRAKTIQLPAINHREPLKIVANRMMAKLGIPKVAMKFKIDYIDYPGLSIGDVFKINSPKLGVSGKVFRVMKITGDNENKPYLNVEAVEDFYGKDLKFDIIDDDGDLYVPVNYELNGYVQYFTSLEAPRETYEGRAALWACGIPNQGDYVTTIHVSVVGGSQTVGKPAIVCELLDNLPEDISTGPGSSPGYSQDYKFRVKDLQHTMYEIAGSDYSLQGLRHTMLIENEIIAFKSATSTGGLGGYEYEIEGLVRGLVGTEIKLHQSGSIVYINQIGGMSYSWVPVNNKLPLFDVYAANHCSVSQILSVRPPAMVPYKDIYDTPYPPVPYIKNGDIMWRPRVARAGANYRAPDTITAGQDEGTVTGFYLVKQPDGSEVVITPVRGDTIITFTPTQVGEHFIKHVSDSSFLSEDWVPITVDNI